MEELVDPLVAQPKAAVFGHLAHPRRRVRLEALIRHDEDALVALCGGEPRLEVGRPRAEKHAPTGPLVDELAERAVKAAVLRRLVREVVEGDARVDRASSHVDVPRVVAALWHHRPSEVRVEDSYRAILAWLARTESARSGSGLVVDHVRSTSKNGHASETSANRHWSPECARCAASKSFPT